MILFGVALVATFIIFLLAINGFQFRSDLSEKLLLILIDKLLLSIAVLFAAYLINQKLELYKQKQALTMEVAKERIKAVSNVVKPLSDYLMHLNILLSNLKTIRERSVKGEKVPQAEVNEKISLQLSIVFKKFEVAFKEIELNSFWLGSELSYEFHKYRIDTFDLLSVAGTETQEKISELKDALESNRPNLIIIIETLKESIN